MLQANYGVWCRAKERWRLKDWCRSLNDRMRELSISLSNRMGEHDETTRARFSRLHTRVKISDSDFVLAGEEKRAPRTSRLPVNILIGCVLAHSFTLSFIPYRCTSYGCNFHLSYTFLSLSLSLLVLLVIPLYHSFSVSLYPSLSLSLSFYLPTPASTLWFISPSFPFSVSVFFCLSLSLIAPCPHRSHFLRFTSPGF